MKQKTVVQELIDWLNNTDSHIDLLDFHNKATELLEKEKQQKINDYNQGYGNGSKRSKTDGQTYITETYEP